MRKIVIYFDCFSGISGDMILGACVGLGIDLKEIRKGLRSLNVKGYKLSSRQVKRNGFIGTKIDVFLNQPSRKGHCARSFNEIKILIDNGFLVKKNKDFFLSSRGKKYLRILKTTQSIYRIKSSG